MLTITMPRPVYRRLKNQARQRQTTISGLLRQSFEYFTKRADEVYSDAELQQLLRRDQLSPLLKKDLDRLLRR